MFRPRHRGSRAPGLAIWLLVAQVLQVGLDRIPPVTLATIGAQVVIFLRLVNLPFGGPGSVCVSALEVWYKEDWKRLLLAAFYHGDEWHLYFNMVSMLWKGINLERRLGSKYFLYMIAVFVLLTNMMIVALSIAAEHVFDDHYYIRQCAVGFSGVLFALKVVSAHLSPPGTQYLMGFIPLPSRIACWGELVLIHILVPRASFIGHLSGILVGLLYIKGPLKYVMDMVYPQGPSYTYRAQRSGYSSGRRSEATGHSGYPSNYTRAASQYDEQGPRYDNYTGGLSEDEQLRRAMEESVRQSYQPNESGRTPSAPPAYEDLNFHTPYPSSPDQGGMPTPPPPQYPTHSPPYPPSQGPSNRLYPELHEDIHHHDNTINDMEELRRRRLDRLAQTRS